MTAIGYAFRRPWMFIPCNPNLFHWGWQEATSLATDIYKITSEGDIAKGSAGELRTKLYIAREIGYLPEEEFQALNVRTEKLSGMLGNLIKAIRRQR